MPVFIRALEGSIALLAVCIFASEIQAGCCDLAKVDAETPAVPVRACEPAADGSCGTELFVGTIELGESRNVCSSADTIVYQEWDVEQSDFAAPVRALCDGAPVEL